MRIKKSQRSLLELLKTSESMKMKVTLDEILEAAGWMPSTFQTYWKKGQLSPFLSAFTDEGPFDVSNTINLSVVEFVKKLSQAKHIQELGHNCASKLAKALLKRSRENMILALELYNRPSLENRLDSFILCFCTSWEQLLKSIIIERYGEDSIFDKDSKIKYGKTISLRNCLNKIYGENLSIRVNIEKIANYRDCAAHLLMPETQGLLSRLFQSGVMNYASEFEDFSELPFLSPNQSGLLTLTGDISKPNLMQLKQDYGINIGSDVAQLIEELETDIEKYNDASFAIPLPIKLVFAKDDMDGHPIILSHVGEGIEGLKNAVIIEKPIDREKTHPHKETEAVLAINRIIKSQCSVNALSLLFVATEKRSGTPCFSSYDFRLIVAKLNWKDTNNEWHYKNIDPEYHRYSEKAITEIADMILKRQLVISDIRNSSKK
ncbi:DUF3644 domain-containing protein [Shewanella cyperi]|uniref:DUF3644 domain-containing protein n=1 Tax=Shewanella cyperi TaxID=2814292 RepID=UPI001A950855|nr:DUF3644 domain-containing protein [Shewanella cyperi]QSX41180.1 DUF3644 domain-containing protein [Shewanella cyperi]